MVKSSVITFIAIFVQINLPNQCYSWCSSASLEQPLSLPRPELPPPTQLWLWWYPAESWDQLLAWGFLSVLAFSGELFFSWCFESFEIGHWNANYSIFLSWESRGFQILVNMSIFLGSWQFSSWYKNGLFTHLLGQFCKNLFCNPLSYC